MENQSFSEDLNRIRDPNTVKYTEINANDLS
jgi:hypothetical protein